MKVHLAIVVIAWSLYFYTRFTEFKVISFELYTNQEDAEKWGCQVIVSVTKVDDPNNWSEYMVKVNKSFTLTKMSHSLMDSVVSFFTRKGYSAKSLSVNVSDGHWMYYRVPASYFFN